MDLILIIVTIMTPVVLGMMLKSEENGMVTKEKNYKEMIKEGYDVYQYGNFDYCYKRS